MTKISANKIFKIVNLLMFIFLVFLCVDCFGSFLLLKSSFESREKKLELPIQSQLNGLDHSDSFKLSLGSRCSSTPGKPSRDEFPKTLKFDLNELPEENDSYLGNGLNQGLIEHPTPNLNTFGRLNRGSARFKTVSSTKINQPKKRMKNDIASWKKPKTLVNWEPRINFQRLVETSDFLEGIERFYWNNELNTFVLVEETIPMVMFFCDSWSHKKKGSTWVKYSSKGLETRHLQDAPASFKFKSVFTNVYRLEKLGDSLLLIESLAHCQGI